MSWPSAASCGARGRAGRHVLGGIPFDERAAAASLRPLLRGRFVEQRPGGFESAALSVRFPDLRPPCDVLADYAR